MLYMPRRGGGLGSNSVLEGLCANREFRGGVGDEGRGRSKRPRTLALSGIAAALGNETNW